MLIKQIPQDFIVDEIPLLDNKLIESNKSGKYIICKLTKTNHNTEDALFHISKKLNVPRKVIGFAGTKDKVAITTQYISIVSSLEKINSFNHDSILLQVIGRHDEPISLGRLVGNKFEIVVRDLNGDEKINKTRIINYFHNQRFSNNNVVVGKFLLKKEYAKAIEILKDDVSLGPKISEHLSKSQNDFVGALKTIPNKILTLYLHAYQSHLWNKSVAKLIELNSLPDEVPIPGFSGFNANNLTTKIINEIMLEENIKLADFLNRDILHLCVEGTMRKTITVPENFVISDFFDDELNSNKKKMIISFSLGKGEYATNVIEHLFS